jgi:hypothetical protein
MCNLLYVEDLDPDPYPKLGKSWIRTSDLYSRPVKAVLRIRIRIRIRIHRIHEFLGLLDPDPDPLVRGVHPDSDPDLSIIKQSKKTLISTLL